MIIKSSRKNRRRTPQPSSSSASRVVADVLVAVRAPDHHGLGVGDLAGGDGDGLGDLGLLGDSGHVDLLSCDRVRHPARHRARPPRRRRYFFLPNIDRTFGTHILQHKINPIRVILNSISQVPRAHPEKIFPVPVDRVRIYTYPRD